MSPLQNCTCCFRGPQRHSYLKKQIIKSFILSRSCGSGSVQPTHKYIYTKYILTHIFIFIYLCIFNICTPFAIRAFTSLLNASPRGSLWKMLIENMGSCIRNRVFFYLLPSADGDLLHSQLFGEIAGKIHFLFC